jgi:hypothetical protein
MKIQKLGYSSNPWRLVTDDGREVALPERFEHPDLGSTVIMMPIRGATRRECEQRALALLGRLLESQA